VLGAGDLPGSARLRHLTDFIALKRLLIVLDNCEHLQSACADLAREILVNCPNARLIATSRQSLGIAGQTAWCVPSLGLPEAALRSDGADDPEPVARSAAVQLFVERAAEVRGDFELTRDNAALVARLCRYLDG